jgi:hypothetical protein
MTPPASALNLLRDLALLLFHDCQLVTTGTRICCTSLEGRVGGRKRKSMFFWERREVREHSMFVTFRTTTKELHRGRDASNYYDH